MPGLHVSWRCCGDSQESVERCPAGRLTAAQGTARSEG